MAFIYTIDDQIPGPVHASIDQGDTLEFSLRILCREGYFLLAVPDGDDLTIEGRVAGSGDAWSDLVAAPIDLSAFAPSLVDFEFRVVADLAAAIGPNERDRLPRIRVAMSTP